MRKVTIEADCAVRLGRLEHSWRYIGYDECNYTYIPEGIAQLKKFASLETEPYHVRTHFTFCTGNCHGTYKFGSTNLYTEDKDGNPVYDYTVYDKIIDAMLESGCKPFIELGFMPMDLVDRGYLTNPANIWSYFSQYKDKGWSCPPKSYDKWHALIKNLMEHLVAKYGREEAASWYFELWNEPDIMYWSSTMAEYCKLFDYTESAFHAVLPEARLSGPAVTGISDGSYSQKFLDYFLAHCKDGVNFYTQEKGTRLDYITFHAKGGGYSFNLNPEKVTPSVKVLIRQIKLGLDSIVKAGYGGLEVVISEADPDGWAAGGMYDNRNMRFRNTEYYATYVASSYHRIEQLCEEYGMTVRPLAWAFLFPAERCFEGTRTFSTQGVDKAVFNVFRMFGKLGYEKIAIKCDSEMAFDFVDKVNITPSDSPADVSGYAVLDENGGAQVLIYSHHDDWDKNEDSKITLNIKGLSDAANHTLKHYRIDRTHSNANTQWEKQNCPLYPQGEQYDSIKAAGALEEYKGNMDAAATENGVLSLTFTMPAHGVSLITIR